MQYRHSLSSSPLHWPILSQGIPFWHGPQGQQVYLLGNPIVWGLSALAMPLLLLGWLVERLAARRQLWVVNALAHRRWVARALGLALAVL